MSDEDLRALFEQIHRVSFEDAEKEGIDSFRFVMEDMFEEFGFEGDFSGLAQA